MRLQPRATVPALSGLFFAEVLDVDDFGAGGLWLCNRLRGLPVLRRIGYIFTIVVVVRLLGRKHILAGAFTGSIRDRRRS